MALGKDLKYLASVMKNVWGRRPSKRGTPIQRALQAGFKRGLLARDTSNASMYLPGADTSRIRQDWNTQVTSATDIIRSEYSILSARSELAYRSDAYARRAIQVLKTFSIGNGLRPIPMAENPITGEKLDAINAQLARDWRRFNDECMRVGPNEASFMQAQGLEFETIATYGSSLANVVQSKDGSLLPFAWQIIKPTELDFSRDTWSFGDRVAAGAIVHGMRMNEYIEPQEFYIKGVTQGRSSDLMSVHYKQSEAQQYLGMPWLTPVLPNVWDNQQLREDKLLQNRALAQMGIWQAKEDRTDLASLATGGTDADDGSDPYIPIDKANYWTTKNKPEAIQFSDDISDAFEPLVKMNVLEIGVGLGFSYQMLTTDLKGMNFASSRANKISDSRFFKSLRAWFAEDVCQRRWEQFVEWEVLEGNIPISPSEFAENKWYYTRAAWLGEGEDWVDPLRDAQSVKLLRELGAMSYKEMVAARGHDPEAFAEELAKENEQLQEAGLEYAMPQNLSGGAAVNSEPVQEIDTDV